MNLFTFIDKFGCNINKSSVFFLIEVGRWGGVAYAQLSGHIHVWPRCRGTVGNKCLGLFPILTKLGPLMVTPDSVAYGMANLLLQPFNG